MILNAIEGERAYDEVHYGQGSDACMYPKGRQRAEEQSLISEVDTQGQI